ncbi:MAG: serine hydrolase [Clostridia bacterium]
MLRIAQCTDSFLPVKDGVGRVAYEYARTLGERGHACYVVTPLVNGECRARYPFEIVDFLSVPQVGTFQYRAGFAALDIHYLSRMDSISLDLVHTHSPGVAGMEAARIADRLHIPLIGTFHSKYFQDYFAPPGEERAATQSARFVLDYYNRCDEIWTVSDDAKELLCAQGFAGNIEVFENGTDINLAEPAAIARFKERFHLLETPILLCVGRLERMKNLPRILEAAAILRTRGVAFQLVFAGQGSEESAIKARVQALNLVTNVRFLGHISDGQMLNALYASASLCLFPSMSITAGLVVCEAAAQGTPSLAIDGSSSAQRIQNGVNGLTCGDTAASMADAIDAFLAAPERIAGIRQCVQNTLPMPWDCVVDRVEERYRELAGMDKAVLKRKRGIFRKELQQVDQSLEKRTFDLIVKFLKQDTQHLYAYPYKPSKRSCLVCANTAPLPRATPESQGVRTCALNALIDAIQADTTANAQQILVMRHGKVIAEASWAPYETEMPHQLYSLSKSIVSTAIGLLVDEGRLRIDERLSDIFFDKLPEDPTHPAYDMCVSNLLNMSTGSLFNEVGTVLGADWEKEFMHAMTKFPVGSAFDYNSMNTYMLAAIVRRKTGQTCLQYLTPRLLQPLGISDATWDVCPNGTEKGGWGLSLSIESVAKIGQLYLNHGRWLVNGEERQLLSEDWIAAATQQQIETPNGEITYGYGHQMWMTSHTGAFLFNGAFGQYMLALPDKDSIVVMFSGTSRLFAQGGVMDEVEMAFANITDIPLPQDDAAQEAFAVTKNGLTVRWRSAFYDPARTGIPTATLADRLDGRVYTFERNVAGLFPTILMNVMNNYATGIERIAFRREADGNLRMEVSEGKQIHRLMLSMQGYTAATIQQREDCYAVRTCFQTELTQTGEWMLHVNIHFIETPFTRVLHFYFKEDRVTLVCDESPSVKDASDMLFELAGVTRTQVFRGIMPLLRRDKLQHTLRTFMTITVQGKL